MGIDMRRRKQEQEQVSYLAQRLSAIPSPVYQRQRYRKQKETPREWEVSSYFGVSARKRLAKRITQP